MQSEQSFLAALRQERSERAARSRAEFAQKAAPMAFLIQERLQTKGIVVDDDDFLLELAVDCFTSAAVEIIADIIKTGKSNVEFR